MGKHQHKRIRPLIGQFIGWEDRCLPHRYVKIATARGEEVVKISKHLRPQIQDWQPGIWLTMLGQERSNAVSGKTKIKVRQLLVSPVALEPSLPSYATVAAQTPVAPVQIKICQGSSCQRRGSKQICQIIQSHLDREHLSNRVEIKTVKCLHQCKAAPHIIMPDDRAEKVHSKTHYRQVQTSEVMKILNQHFPLPLPSTPTIQGSDYIEAQQSDWISSYFQYQTIPNTF